MLILVVGYSNHACFSFFAYVIHLWERVLLTFSQKIADKTVRWIVRLETTKQLICFNLSLILHRIGLWMFANKNYWNIYYLWYEDSHGSSRWQSSVSKNIPQKTTTNFPAHFLMNVPVKLKLILSNKPLKCSKRKNNNI